MIIKNNDKIMASFCVLEMWRGGESWDGIEFNYVIK